MLNFAFVGCGNMAHWHAQELLKLGEVRVAAVVDVATNVAEKFRRQYEAGAPVYRDLQSLLREPPPALDAVVIVTPHTLHFEQATAALDAGLHVLVEKPMVTRPQDGSALWRTVKRTGKLLGITFQSPYSAQFQYLARARDAGTLGTVRAVTGYVAQNWLGPTTGTWRQVAALSGGGFVYDTGAHLLNAVMWLMNDPVVEVGCFLDDRGSPVDITGTVVMKFANGATGSLTFVGDTPSFESELKLFTDRFMIYTDAYGRRLEIFGNDRSWFDPGINYDVNNSPHANFVAAINGREPLRAPVRYGVMLSVLMDAMYRSASNGQIVKVDPVPTDID